MKNIVNNLINSIKSKKSNVKLKSYTLKNIPNTFEYKGYHIILSHEDTYFYGQISGIPDCIIFQGDSIDELKEEFVESVDMYINMCKECNKIPDEERIDKSK